jgi:acyl-CoA synthetase (AMP-forming)/AMP-acid ligase II
VAGRPLTAVLLPRPDAARAVNDRWDRDEAVAVLDPALPAAALGREDDDRALVCLPLHHVAGLAILARARVNDTPVTVRPSFDVDAAGAAPAREGATLEALRTFAADHLSRAQLPKEVVHVDAIPRTSGGKLLRRELRAPR